MNNLFRTIILVVTVGLLTSTNASGDVGGIGSVGDGCDGDDVSLDKLCRIATKEFGTPAGEYVYLGGDVYLVAVDALARVRNGVYLANVKSEGIKQFGGYAETELIGVKESSNGSMCIHVKQYDMSHGRWGKVETRLERRVNPITKMPYVVSETVYTVEGFSEELESFCAKPENKRSPECAGASETAILTEKDPKSRPTKSRSVDRVLANQILDAHKKALRIPKNMRYKTLDIMEDAGIRGILDVKPVNMSRSQYVNVLNDYAFWAYGYGEGRTELAIEILYKVIRISPGRAVAYLNMADALEYLTEYGSTPLDDETIYLLRKSAATYRDKYRSMLREAQNGTIDR